MEVTLLHNPKAGDENTGRKELIKQFERAGHTITYQSTKRRGLARALEKPGDLVVVAGGDGTVGKVARRLLGRNVPMAILPLGTANNIANALGRGMTPQQFVESLEHSHPLKFDVGMARGPWGDMVFLEGAGAGLFPRMMSEHESNRNDGVPDAVDAHGGLLGGVKFLQRVLDPFRGHEFVVRFDSEEMAGKYLLIEVMNIPTIGPALKLAPDADPSDGLLDVVVVRHDAREELKRYLADHFAKDHPPPFKVHRTRRVYLSCAATEFHIDDELWLWPDGQQRKPNGRRASPRDIHVEFELFPGALRMMVPA
jgi:diacylglycerol kinase (ATP)